MKRRLQILVEETEFESIHRAAEREGLTMSEWARKALRQAGRDHAHGDVARKLASVRSAVVHDFPTAEIDEMLAQIRPAMTR